ncbi:MAG: Crp/Fnr family transcriptional regulator [Firmicutes bacterium]|nr:Crp/Fnr family transcriptional regulator [Bacillota bacterium]
MKLTKSQQETVKRCFLFKGMEMEETARVLERFEARSFRGNEQIYTPVAFERALGIVVEGEVSVHKPGGAQLNVIQKGGCFGAAALFDESDQDFSYVTTLVAHKACQVVFMSDEDLEACFRLYPVMAMNYIRFLSGRIRFLNRRIDSFTSPTSEEALFSYLKEQAADGTKVQITSFAKLARTLSMSRATLYRALSKLEADHRIQKDGNEIILVSK